MALLRELIQPASLERCGDRSFPVLSMTMHDGIMLQSDRFKKSLASVDQSAYKVVRRNQLVVGFPIDEGVLYIQKVADAGIMSPAYDVWNVDETKVNLQYFELCLHSPQSMMFYKTNLRGTTARRRSLPKETLLSLPVPVPSMERQREIASTISRLKKLIELRQRQLRTLDTLIKARFVEMFGEHGRQVPLSDFVWFQEGPGVRSVDFTNEGVILLTGSNINDNEITFGHKSDRFISRALADGRYAHFMCDIDDILVVSSAIDPEKFDKKVTIVREDKKYCLNTGIIRFKPDRKVMTLSYFREFLKTDYFKHQVMEEMRGIAQMHFGPSHLKKMTILLPDSLEQQRLFEDFVSQVDKSKVVVQKALDEAQLLFDSLMQKYFG